jgi:hypothetical protein
VDVGEKDLDTLKFEEVLELNFQSADMAVIMLCLFGVPE